ncbi:hypothetical protein L2725_21375 [Shewanella corallii]|uniref:Uncharacterized protein n=1 Tax=Shewanella corallii TaxID=560080 RepID=A0ABT0ND57_9GAMM|nr:hypothetical protein [Shewanella corallii]MCL2916290.1 hypothetical protein [Shewanella corallii]
MNLQILLLLSQSLAAAFNPESAIREQSASFQYEASADIARVSSKIHVSDSVLLGACRRALLLPHKKKNHQALQTLTGLTLPEQPGYFQADVSSFQLERQQDWIYCTGQVALAPEAQNLAGLAMAQAWSALSAKRHELLRPLLKFTLDQEATYNDSLILIAISAGGTKGVEQLKQHLLEPEFLLDVSRFKGAEFLQDAGEFELALGLLEPCRRTYCYSQYLELDEHWQQASADNLKSYF